jgi:hypothetical protein
VNIIIIGNEKFTTKQPKFGWTYKVDAHVPGRGLITAARGFAKKCACAKDYAQN